MQSLGLDSIIILAGSPHSGKSNLIKYLMSHICGQFNYGVAMCPTAYDGGYDWLPKEWVHADCDPIVIENLMAIQSQTSKNRAFLILDDCLARFNFNDQMWTQLITTTRHLRITIIIATQYTAKLPTIFRECASYVFMFKQNIERSFRLLYENFGQTGQFRRWEDFRDWLNRETLVPYSCVLYSRDGNGSGRYARMLAPDMSKPFVIAKKAPKARRGSAKKAR